LTYAAKFGPLDGYLSRACDKGDIPGAVVRLGKDGEAVFYKAYGWLDHQQTLPMPLTAVFQAKSMTKLATSLAMLITVERGLAGLLEPVDKFIPSFGQLKVLKSNADIGATEPLHRPLTLYDLLTHTSGLSYGQCDGLTQQLYKNAGLYFDIDFRTPLSTQELVDRLAGLPLAFQPGARWAYSWASDVIGRALEIVHDAPLDEVFRRLIFGPLSMQMTGFRFIADMRGLLVPSPRHSRIFYREMDNDDEQSFLSGGEGLLTTADDWGRLVDMMVNDTADVGLLSTRLKDYMLADHIGRLREHPTFPLQQAFTYGMGVYLRLAKGLSTAPGWPGEFGWWGSWGCAFWGNRQERLSGVLMMQQPDESRAVVERVKLLAYAALES
jgi:CubicO group peptidase (beta-lactamase class C family)